MNRRINQAGLDLLKQFEGFSSDAYKDVAGIWTIGYGFTNGVKPGDKITKEGAELRLRIELMEYENAISQYVQRDLTDNQFSSCVVLAYNIGAKAFHGSTLCRLLNTHTPIKDCAKWFLPWNKATINGKLTEVRGLTNRRQAEMELFLK